MDAFLQTSNDDTVSQDEPAIDREVETTWDAELAEVEVEVVESEEVESTDNEPIEDSVQLYLHEIGQVALLTADEERTLAMAITRAKDARTRLNNEDYSSGYERMLSSRQLPAVMMRVATSSKLTCASW